MSVIWSGSGSGPHVTLITFLERRIATMSKMDQIKADMIAALKAGERQRKDNIAYLYGILKNVQIDKRADLTVEEINSVIMKQIKQVQETIDSTPASRPDLLAEAQANLALLQEYAPQMMDEAQIQAEIQAVLNELGIESPTPKDKGRIMKVLMPRVKGKADGALVNQLLGKVMQ